MQVIGNMYDHLEVAKNKTVNIVVATSGDTGSAAIAALRETGVSMTYTSIILFCGFTVFAFSEFGGTQAMGILISFTLLIAMLANLCVLPSLLMSLNKSVTTKAFNEPMLEILDEEEDIEVNELKVKEGQIGEGSSVFGGQPIDQKP